MTDIRTGLVRGAERLAAAGIPNPRAEARRLLAHAAQISLEIIIGYPERPIENEAGYLRLLERRAAREPLSHLTGRREFWSLEFAVTPDTLDPRPDTETLVEAVLDHVSDPKAGLRIIDLGTGTGCLLGALLSQLPNAFGVAVDRNPAAAATAARNLAALGFSRRSSIVVGDWCEALTGRFDILVSNPPYIPSADIDALEPEVAVWESRLALDGGPDGMAAYRRIIGDLPNLLAPDGFAAFEFGDGQGDAVAELLVDAGITVYERRCDLASLERCMVFGFGRATAVHVKV